MVVVDVLVEADAMGMVMSAAVVVVVVVGGVVFVTGSGSTPGVHARTMSSAIRGAASLIPTTWPYPHLVFGPLNGVRVALVISAAVAGIVAILAGFVVAGIVLLAGVALHGVGWLYLYTRRYPDTTD